MAANTKVLTFQKVSGLYKNIWQIEKQKRPGM